jgi:hypothetical protein
MQGYHLSPVTYHLQQSGRLNVSGSMKASWSSCPGKARVALRTARHGMFTPVSLVDTSHACTHWLLNDFHCIHSFNPTQGDIYYLSSEPSTYGSSSW